MNKRASFALLTAASAVFLTACGGGDSGADAKAENGDRSDVRKTAAKAQTCPPEFEVPAPANGAPSLDILNVSWGMNYDQAAAVLTCKYPDLPQDIGEWHTTNTEKEYGIVTRQHLRITDGRECSLHDISGARTTGEGVCQSMQIGGELPPRKSPTKYVNVILSGMPDHEVVYGVWREEVFDKDAQPALADLKAPIIAKFGEPHKVSMHTYLGETYHWMYDPAGDPVEPNTRYHKECARNLRPDFDKSQTWSEACGMTLSVRFEPARGNDMLVGRLRMAFIDQKGLFDANVVLKAALEAESYRQNALEAHEASANVAAVDL